MNYKLQDLPQLEDIQKIFLVGIKGVGMMPIALILNEAGFDICGSDIADKFITDKYLSDLKIDIVEGFDVRYLENFFNGVDSKNCLVITTGAHKGYDNPQVKLASEKNIAILTQGQALSFLMDGKLLNQNYKGIAVAGSHGKTTTAAMLITAMESLSKDCSYSVGTGEIFPMGLPGHFGKGSYFIAEADEYASEPVYDKVPKFLYLNPTYAIFNNIDFDHPDIFSDIASVEDAFIDLAHNIKSGGILVLNGDDERLRTFGDKINKDIKIVSFGCNSNNTYQIKKIVTFGLSTKFTIVKKAKELGMFEISVPGIHNARNAAGVIALLSEMGFESQSIRSSLKVFTGTKRRMEIVGNTRGGALIMDDYGHHPLEISTTIRALSQAYPDKKIVCVFQPHTYSRTKALLQDFANSFTGVHQLILLPIFRSARDTESDVISNDDYVEAHKKLTDTEFIENFDDVVKYLNENFSSNEFLILTIGAGNVYNIGYKIKA